MPREETQTCVGEVEKLTVKVGLHQDTLLSPNIFNLKMAVLKPDTVQPALLDMLLADNIVLTKSLAKE